MKKSSNEHNLVIEKYSRSNELKIKQLIDLYNEESYLFNLLQDNKTKCAYVAYYKKDVVGIFFAWNSNFHPYCTYFRIYTKPFYSGLHIEQFLLNEIQKRENFKLPLQTSIWETSAHLKAYYEEHNFTEIRRTYMPILDLQKIILTNQILNLNYHLQTLSNILSNNSLLKKLAHLVKMNYEQTHLANPVASFPLETWQKMILADDILLEGSFLIIDEENEIIGYSFLHTSKKDNTLELGLCGTHTTDNLPLLKLLVLEQTTYANKNGYSFVQGEFDSTSMYAMEILKSFPFNPCPTWITYQKETRK
ncbi:MULTISPECIES: GNAT family acetyltransferase [Bacillus cereus group]|uniref:GNAT family acetyltransferase n=1 Tax=Bacillus cereus TaxID=1396 RepID=A0A2C0F1A5_BACCE|nr:GNAT family acetyltransferase [Bacillus cereus]PDY77485.1 GNAT family acetyltransferase [Bacillus cereus]PFA04152.1 GNAT family acetyltransferase [Bacillus cereus]PFM38671.1 GNAT family acetyltransferase [Bacillus cereus]PGL63060.1 GNAT family acetyltransferase [Bacillus cereus]PGQ12274.1 GNAT family acetyltransferase [Bacillus cereus]